MTERERVRRAIGAIVDRRDPVRDAEAIQATLRHVVVDMLYFRAFASATEATRLLHNHLVPEVERVLECTAERDATQERLARFDRQKWLDQVRADRAIVVAAAKRGGHVERLAMGFADVLIREFYDARAGYASPSVPELHERLGCTQANVPRAYRTLVRRGHLEVIVGGRGQARRNRYIPILHGQSDLPFDVEDMPFDEDGDEGAV
jgi:hypothetical protein